MFQRRNDCISVLIYIPDLDHGISGLHQGLHNISTAISAVDTVKGNNNEEHVHMLECDVYPC